MNRRARTWAFLKAPFEGIPPLALVLGGVGTAFAFLFFNQPDLFHTVVSSYAYLDGHIVDFYEYNKTVVGGNDYLPGIYVILAIWMSPFKLFGALTPEALRPALLMSPLELLWAKLLLLLVFLACFYVLSAIARLAFAESEDKQRTIRTAYLFSPLVGFAVFTFGQYDIFSSFFTLLGVLMYMRRRPFWFVFWFSIAISFKYFAFFLFVPLAIYYFKRPLRILLAFAGGAACTLILLVSYWHSPPFRTTAVRIAGGKAGDPLHNQILLLMGLFFLILCVLAFLYGRRRNDLTHPLILIWLAGFAIMFLAVTWHPQWTVILAPAFALSLGLMKRPGLFLIWESVAFVAFVIVFTNRWVANVDAMMITRGILSFLIGDPTLLQHDVIGAWAEPFASIVTTLFFISPLVWLAGERAAGIRQNSARNPRRWIWSMRALTVPIALTLPSLAFTFVPWESAVALIPSAVANGTVPVSSSAAIPSASDPAPGDELEQDFVVEGDGFTGISLPTATFQRRNAGVLDVVVEDARGTVIAQATFDAAKLGVDERVYVAFSEIPDSDGRSFTLHVSQSESPQGPRAGYWTVPYAEDSGVDELILNGVTTTNSLWFSYFLRG